MANAPQVLVAGHIVKDLTPNGWRPGGGVLYAAAQAARLGKRVAAVTACDSDIDPAALVPGAEWRITPSPQGMVFENVYASGVRSQRVSGSALPLTPANVPQAWLDTPLVLLAPVFHDVDESLPALFHERGALLGLAAQGWLRRLDAGRVVPGEVEQRPAWLRGEAVFVSEEDVADPEAVATWRTRVPVVVLTRGRSGCSVWDKHGRHEVAAVPTREVDPTGAGDVFSAAFLVRFSETRQAVESARFASAAAALAIRGAGLDAIATRDEIEASLAQDAAVRAL